jgi:hypothetical protein
MQERDGCLEDAAQVFDEMSIHVVLENARALLLGEASRVQDAVGGGCCSGVQEGRTQCGRCCGATIWSGPAQGAVEPHVEDVEGR